MKHIDLRTGWMEDLIQKQRLEIKYVEGSKNGADIFTKLVTPAKRHEWCDTYMTNENGFLLGHYWNDP